MISLSAQTQLGVSLDDESAPSLVNPYWHVDVDQEKKNLWLTFTTLPLSVKDSLTVDFSI